MNPNELKTIKAETILHTSWGYDQTNNDYCKVLENKTGKTLKCIMIHSKIIKTAGFMSEYITPNTESEYGKPFRVRIQTDDRRVWLVGSYPFCQSDTTAKRRGNWGIWNGKADLETNYA